MKKDYSIIKKARLSTLLLLIMLSLGLQSKLSAQTYTSIKDGNWTASSTWQGGSVPPTGNISNGITININHLINYNSGNSIDNDGIIRIERKAATITKASLEFPTGINFNNNSTGEVYIIDGAFYQCRFDDCGNGDTSKGESTTKQSGTFKNIGGFIYVDRGSVEVAQDWTGESGGTRIFIDSCLKTGQNFTLSGSSSYDVLMDTSVSVGWHESGNFSVADGTIYFDGADIQLAGTSGSFELNSGKASGLIDYVTLKNHVTNSTGSGKISISSSISTSVSAQTFTKPNPDYDVPATSTLTMTGYCAGTFEDSGNKITGTPTSDCTLTTTLHFFGICSFISNAKTGDDIEQCETSTFNLVANEPVASVSGTWTVVSGTATITSLNSATTTATAVPVGTTATLRWTMSDGNPAANTTNDIILTNSNSVAGTNIDQTGNSSFTLAGNTPLSGFTGSWSFVGASGSAAITTASSPTSGITGVSSGTSVTLRWTVTNGTCSSTDDVVLTNNSGGVNTVGSPSSTETLCISTVLNTITHTTTGATGIAD
ncbi:MAG: hypothetical protein JKY44_09985, partial [Flavobacteriaceae bacterium]|nr:hypothetical protein [Flavobacteriaceae bacterium]